MKIGCFLAAALICLLAAPAVSYTAAPETSSGILRTRDGIDISYEHRKRGSDSVIIVCPGFYNSRENLWMRRAAGIVSSKYDVIIFDFRGHGRSGGKYTWSARENMDVDAVLDYAKSCGYKHVGILAFSLGAAAAVNSAASRGDIDSMVLISCPSRFDAIDYHFWEPAMLSDLMDNIASGWQGKGARAANIFMRKEDPIDNIGRIKNAAILFIHGDRDWVVKPRHSVKLCDEARTAKEVRIVKGGMHAERLIQFREDAMKDAIMGWFSDTLTRKDASRG